MLLHRRQAISRFIRESATYWKTGNIPFTRSHLYKYACILYICTFSPTNWTRDYRNMCNEIVWFFFHTCTCLLSLTMWTAEILVMVLFSATCSKTCKADHDDVVRHNECKNDYYAAALYIWTVSFSKFHEGFSLDYRSGVHLPRRW